MRLLIIALIALTIGTTACSKKSSSTVVATPPATPTDPNPPVDPSNTGYGLTSDNIVSNRTGANYLDMNYGSDAHTGYFQLIHSAFGYQSSFTSRYGVNSSYPYAAGRTCNNAYLDDLYYNLGYDFANCTEYTNYLDYLADGEIYLEAKLVDATTVDGNIHATILHPPPTYHVTELFVPYRGKVTKKQIDATRYYYEIAIGSSLLIYTADSTTTPVNRDLTMDFGNYEIGHTQLILQP
jgi:hypothetical protein